LLISKYHHTSLAYNFSFLAKIDMGIKEPLAPCMPVSAFLFMAEE